jgi:hypothetical protein
MVCSVSYMKEIYTKLQREYFVEIDNLGDQGMNGRIIFNYVVDKREYSSVNWVDLTQDWIQWKLTLRIL